MTGCVPVEITGEEHWALRFDRALACSKLPKRSCRQSREVSLSFYPNKLQVLLTDSHREFESLIRHVLYVADWQKHGCIMSIVKNFFEL